MKASAGSAMSLINRSYQKGLRPQDKFIPLDQLKAEEQALIKRHDPERFTKPSE